MIGITQTLVNLGDSVGRIDLKADHDEMALSVTPELLVISIDSSV